MLKLFLHKTLAALLTLLVLFSTVSFTVEKHYCGTNLVDIAVFSKVKSCTTEAIQIFQKKSCCSDEVDVVKGQDELKVGGFDDLDLKNQQFIIAYTFNYTSWFKSLPKQIIPNKGYSPPNLVADIQVLDQVFII